MAGIEAAVDHPGSPTEAVLAAKVGEDLHKEDKEGVADNLEEGQNTYRSLADNCEEADHFGKLLDRALNVRLKS